MYIEFLSKFCVSSVHCNGHEAAFFFFSFFGHCFLKALDDHQFSLSYPYVVSWSVGSLGSGCAHVDEASQKMQRDI